ncbi:hypothetical protein BO78DRAFT_395340 [Aspergillus sclerotiicarbonarius CBS 121057]|uniref:Uncharacterized protein n=1 Tax=Aspergillus sclerotiicarbonarius (strain CBS 121057 / IBT 28362) TaxID=1448318 RepID=A0A319EM57_ASPSB|nr:hypothetical protein BO78DRAFT_395340 [Aspergillus sclerotiicarbonarius CBS 121057]
MDVQSLLNDDSLSLAPTYGLPRFQHAEGTNSLLLVVITDLSDTDEAALIDELQHSPQPSHIKVSTWRPSRNVLARVAHQCPRPDSQENMYAVAILAYRAGWTGLVVADGLTQRQLHGALRVGEDPLASVAMVAIRPRPATTSAGDDVCVFAQRATVGGKSNAELLETLRTLQPRPQEGPWLRDLYRDVGMILHDPGRGPFTLDKAAQLGREEWLQSTRHVLATQTPLPAELVESVVSHASSGSEGPIAPPSWVHPDLWGEINIFLLFPTTPAELQIIQSTLDGVAKSWIDTQEGPVGRRTFKLISWEHHHAMSRRQLMNLWHGYDLQRRSGGMETAICFLMKPVDNAADIQIGIFHYSREGQAIVTHKPLHQILERPDATSWPVLSWLTMPGDFSLDREETEVTELLHDFDQPFYANPPRWLPTKSDLNCVALFSLAQTTPNQADAIKAELRTRGQVERRVEEKFACFVPWDGEEHGTLDDIWKIVWELYTYYRGNRAFFPIFFADQQSAADNTVLGVHPRPAGPGLLEGLPLPSLGGFAYGRVPGRDAHAMYENVRMRRMAFSDVTEVNVFRRPDWPKEHDAIMPAEPIRASRMMQRYRNLMA